MTSSAITPGSTATVSTNVTVSVDNADSYSLTLKMNSDKLTSGSTTINPGNVVSDNTWGYKWDNASTYTAPSTTAQTLTVPALSNNAVSFTKNLTFGAKFATSADAGHYKGSGTLSLVATPKAATLGIWSNGTNSGITTMQEMTSAVCNQVGTPASTANVSTIPTMLLTDSRDNNTYKIAKYPDGRCWMTENLKLMGSRTLTSTDSDVSSNWTLPASSTIGFSDYTASNAYLSGTTGYYTWCAATAGTCSGATSSGTNATSSICPKGWKLPTGGTSGNTDFYNLFKNTGLTISDSLATSGSTSWSIDDLSKVQGLPYGFTYTGYMSDNSADGLTASSGVWWSRMALNNNYAYALYIVSSGVRPGTYGNDRDFGFAVRCIAEEPTLFTLTFDPGNDDHELRGNYLEAFQKDFAAQTSPVGYDGSSYTFTIPNIKTAYGRYYDSISFVMYSVQGWTTVKGSSTVQYTPGSTITLTSSNPALTLYPIWAVSGGGGSIS